MISYVDVRGVRVPSIGLGTWQLVDEKCRASTEKALELGYRHIDTAQMYGNEWVIGEVLGRSGIPRDDLWITSKLAPGNERRQAVLETTRESVKRLACERLDLLLVHWPSREVPLAETLGAMTELMDEGLVRRIGVSNFPPGLLKEALSLGPVSCIQVEYHPFLGQSELIDLAVKHDLLFTAYSPLARGEVKVEPTLRRIGERYGKSPGQVALRWLTQQPRVSAIPKAASFEHLVQNIDIFDFELTQEEMRSVYALDRGKRYIDPEFSPDWSYA